MSDSINEELQIASEQDDEGTVLAAESFTLPIKRVTMPKAISVEEGTSLGEVVSMMQEKKIGSIVITNKGKLTGILTERDILMKVIGKMENWQTTAVSEVMTSAPQSLMEDDEIAYVLNNMHIGGYRHIPIVNENEEPIAMMSIKDVVGWILDHFPNEIANMTGEPYRGEKSRDGG
jgi:predicted transcriptional regulator